MIGTASQNNPCPQSACVAWQAAAAHAVTCSDYNFNDASSAVTTGSVVITKDSCNSFIIYYIYVLLYIISTVKYKKNIYYFKHRRLLIL